MCMTILQDVTGEAYVPIESSEREKKCAYELDFLEPHQPWRVSSGRKIIVTFSIKRILT